MNMRAIFIGGLLAGGLGAAIGGSLALAGEQAASLWLHSALGAAIISAVSWGIVRRRVL